MPRENVTRGRSCMLGHVWRCVEQMGRGILVRRMLWIRLLGPHFGLVKIYVLFHLVLMDLFRTPQTKEPCDQRGTVNKAVNLGIVASMCGLYYKLILVPCVIIPRSCSTDVQSKYFWIYIISAIMGWMWVVVPLSRGTELDKKWQRLCTLTERNKQSVVYPHNRR